MNFSNESYEAFEVALRESGASDDSLRWRTRDMIFSALFHEPPTLRRLIGSSNLLFAVPGGWMIWVALRKVWGAFSKVRSEFHEADRHFLCLSRRSNHVARLQSAIDQRSGMERCVVWLRDPGAEADFNDEDSVELVPLGACWADHLSLRHLETANQEANHVEAVFPEATFLSISRLKVTLAMFLGAEAFWRRQLEPSNSSVLVTYEKDPLAKALLSTAEQMGVDERIHWTHGLRHSSQRATVANRMWCLTESDADYFRTRVPEGCEVSVKPSPESLHWIKVLGMLPKERKENPEFINFLVLGSGKDPGYTTDMSQGDMAVVASAATELGKRVRWRFRPHPGNVEQFQRDIVASGLGEVDFSTRPLVDDLAWSHAVGSAFSSVAIDIEPTGRPVFWIQAELRSLYSVREMVEAGLGIHLGAENAVVRIRETFRIS